MKKVFSTVVAFLLLLSLIGSYTVNVCAEEFPVLSEMTTAAQIEFLEQRGVEVPGGEVNYEYWGPFISDCIALVESDPAYMFRYNWTVSQDFAMAIQVAVNNHYGITPNFVARFSTHSRLSLIQNEILLPWDQAFALYNCYSYAIDETDGSYNAGSFSGNSYTTIDIDVIADCVIADLVSSTIGHTCVALYTSDSNAVITNQTICMRVSQYDAHYMKKPTKFWQHKPGGSAPLKFIATMSSNVDWSDEQVINNIVYRTDEHRYSGPIYYFTPLSSHVGYSNTVEYTSNHYHSGTFHFYTVWKTCTSCGKKVEAVIKKPCSGPPCEVSFNSIVDLPIVG